MHHAGLTAAAAALALLAATPRLAAADLAAARNGFEKGLADIERASRQAMQGWPVEYLQALDRLAANVQKTGDFDGLMAVRKEAARFRKTRELSEALLATTPVALARLQETCLERRRKLDETRSRRVLELVKRYTKHLLALRTELTRQNKLADAVKVNAEIERVKRDPRVTAAEFAIANVQATKPGPNDGDPAESKEIDFPPTSAGVVVHAETPAPAIPGVPLGVTLGLHNTAHAPLTPVVDVSAVSGSRIHYARGARVTRSYVRISTAPGNSGKPIKAPLLVIRYFAKQVHRRGRIRSGMPRLMDTYYARLPDLAAHPVVTDVGPVPADIGHGMFPAKWRGYAICGAVISIYKRNGALLYQAVTDKELLRFAQKELPDEA